MALDNDAASQETHGPLAKQNVVRSYLVSLLSANLLFLLNNTRTHMDALNEPTLSLLLLLFSCSVLSLCNLMDCTTPGFPVLHYLPEFAQIHVH